MRFSMNYALYKWVILETDQAKKRLLPIVQIELNSMRVNLEFQVA